MSVGERALIHCGPKFGWSIARHRPAACPANTPLAFTVELVRFEKVIRAVTLISLMPLRASSSSVSYAGLLHSIFETQDVKAWELSIDEKIAYANRCNFIPSIRR